MTRIIGLDHGARRIGVAIGDTDTRMAFARPAIRRRNLQDDVAQIGELCAEERAELVVIGLPLRMDGTEGDEAARARSFGAAVGGSTGASVLFEDERLTSWDAGERLASEGRRPDRRSGELDSTAARLILQQYLDAQPAAPSHDSDSAEESE